MGIMSSRNSAFRLKEFRSVCVILVVVIISVIFYVTREERRGTKFSKFNFVRRFLPAELEFIDADNSVADTHVAHNNPPGRNSSFLESRRCNAM